MLFSDPPFHLHIEQQHQMATHKSLWFSNFSPKSAALKVVSPASFLSFACTQEYSFQCRPSSFRPIDIHRTHGTISTAPTPDSSARCSLNTIIWPRAFNPSRFRTSQPATRWCISIFTTASDASYPVGSSLPPMRPKDPTLLPIFRPTADRFNTQYADQMQTRKTAVF